MAYEISKDVAARIRAEFQRVLDTAAPAYDLNHQLGLFEPELDRWIGVEVDRKLYEQELPCGGAREEAIVEKLEKYKIDHDHENNWPGHGLIRRAIEAWKAICPEPSRTRGSGWYYVCRKLSPKQ